MTQKEIDHIRKRERWREIIARQKESGLGPYDFCKKEEVSTSSFYYWQSLIIRETLGDAAMLGVLKAPPLVEGAEETARAVEEIAFQPVDAASPNLTHPCDEARLCQIIDYAVTEGELSGKRLCDMFHMGHALAATILTWLEAKGIVKRHASCHPCEVLITRDQWDAMKDQLLTTDRTVADLLLKSEEPAVQETVFAPEAEPAHGNTYIEKLDKLYPQFTAEKRNDSKPEPAADKVMIDIEKKRVYVYGDVRDETIKAIAKLMKELGY